MDDRDDMEANMPKTCKSCDHCRNRKVRCTMAPGAARCANCLKRDKFCEFKAIKRRLRNPRRHVDNATSSHATENSPPNDSQIATSSSPMNHGAPAQLPTLAPLYIDQMLEEHRVSGVTEDFHPSKIQGSHMPSPGLTFLSERSVAFLTQRIGNIRLQELIEMLKDVINSRQAVQRQLPSNLVTFHKPAVPEPVSPAEAGSYLEAYFENLHAVYPFLNRCEFEEKAQSPGLDRLLATDPPFSALYHAVLALGCQYREGGAFDPGKGKAWRLFQMSLGLMTELLVPRDPLLSLQALVAMSIFTLNMCCLQIDETLLLEAAAMAVALRYHKPVLQDDSNNPVSRRTFWLIYVLEKHLAFQGHRNSIIADCDISCPIPASPEATFGTYDWLLSSVHFARILAQAYESLFSASATTNSPAQHRAAIRHVHERVERWRMSVPEDFRPGSNRQHCVFTSAAAKSIFIRTQYNYYALVITLARLILYVDTDEPGCHSRREKTKRELMVAARTVIGLIRCIDTGAYTPIFILAVVPLSALFVLFEFVIHNPTHPETRSNMSLLDVAAGHFSLLEFTSGGSLPASCIAEFAHIARTFVRNCETNYTGETGVGEDDGSRDAGPSGDGDGARLDNAGTPRSHSRELYGATTDLADMEGLDSGVFGTIHPGSHSPGGFNACPPLYNWDSNTGSSMDESLYYPSPAGPVAHDLSAMMPGLDLRSFFGFALPSVGIMPSDEHPEMPLPYQNGAEGML